jgi:putative peptidoglycan lipid II flippase
VGEPHLAITPEAPRGVDGGTGVSTQEPADTAPADLSLSDRSLVRSSAAVALGTTLSRLTGLMRVGALAYALGKTLADTYNVANNTPNIVFELILGGVLTATLVPLFVDAYERDDDDAVSAIFGTAMVVLVALTAVTILAAPLIAHLFTFRAQGANRAIERRVATDLIRLFIPQMVFYGLTALLSAMLNARRKFLAAAYAPVLNNVVVIALLLILPHVVTGGGLSLDHVARSGPLVLILGLGTTAGIALMGLVLLPATRGAGIHLRFVVSWKHPAVRTAIRLSGWTVGYVIANQIALAFVLIIAGNHPGVVSAYTYAFAFFQLPYGLVAVSIMTTLGPELASLARRGDTPGLRARFSVGLRSLLIVITPAAVGYAVLSRQIVVGLLEHGLFGHSDAVLAANALRGFAVGIVPFAVYLYALRGFYALRDTKTPFIVNCVENALNIVFAAILYPHFGISGLAYAFSAAYAVAAVVALVMLRSRIGGLDGRRSLQTTLRAAIAATALAIATALVAHAISEPLVAAIAASVVGAIVYLVVLQALGAEEIRAALSAVRRTP